LPSRTVGYKPSRTVGYNLRKLHECHKTAIWKGLLTGKYKRIMADALAQSQSKRNYHFRILQISLLTQGPRNLTFEKKPQLILLGLNRRAQL
jgi:hypothetical protein